MTVARTLGTEEPAEDRSASVDLSVAFFCSVLMLLVFVSFNVTDVPERPPRASLGQKTPNRPAVPPGWSPLLERGGWAVLTHSTLTRLDLAPILDQVREGRNSIVQENGGVSWRARRNHAAARAFVLDLGLDPHDLPELWRNTVVPLDGTDPAECLAPAKLLTVIVPHDLPDIGPFLAYAARCGIPYRFEVLKPPRRDGSVIKFSIGLTSGSYARERVFR